MSLSDKALLKQEVNSFNIFLSTNKKDGVKYLSSYYRHIRTGLSIYLSLSSFDKSSLGCYSNFNKSLRHLEAEFLIVLSTLIIKSNVLIIILNLCYKIKEVYYYYLSSFLKLILQTL